MIIRQKYGLFAILLFATFTFNAYAQNNWEGTAVVGRYGEFPPGGLYVASNTFPLNSMVSVTNMSSGKTARLIVAKTVDDPGVFMLLSEAAAVELGVTSENTIGVRVEPVQLPGLTSVDPNKDLPYHPDPDVNPAASLGDPNASIIQPQTPTDAVASDAMPDTPDAPAPAPPTKEEPVRPVVEEIAPPAESELPTERPEPVPPQPEDPAPDTPVAEVDETDFVGDGGVIGTAPTIAAQIVEESGEPEVSMPRVNPAPQPPMSVALVLPNESNLSSPEEEIEIADSGNAVPAPVPEEPIPVPAESGDPLAERLAEVESELAQERISAAPLEVSPIGTVAAPANDAGVGESIPEVDLTAAFVAEASPATPEPPNPVRVVVELPLIEDTTVPQAMIAAPTPPEVGPGEIALPLVPVEGFLEESDDLQLTAREEPLEEDLPEPTTPTGVVAEIDSSAETEEATVSEPLRPTKIPDDAIITLEPADYRSPEPPEPEVDELEVVEPAEEEEAVALAEPRETDAADIVEEEGGGEETPTETAVVESTPAPAEAIEAPSEVAVVTDDDSWAAANLPLIPRLSSGSAYVQVAAFSNPRSAKQTIDAIGTGFPVAVVSSRATDREVYRVFVGPLREDEKGSALYALRSRGFRDAFVRDPE